MNRPVPVHLAPMGVAVGSSLTFFVNCTPVWSGTDSTLRTGKVGIGFARDATATTFQVDSVSAVNAPTAG